MAPGSGPAKSVKAQRPPFVDHCVELLAPLGSVRVKRMFGGWGLYVDELFMAVLAYERLFLKTDASTAPHFLAAGCKPFCFEHKGGEMVATSYYSPPDEALDSPALMQPWARLALQAALAARAAKAPRKAKTIKPASTKARGRA